MYTFLYTVQYYFADQPHTAHGIIYAKDFTDCVRQIEAYYGDDLENIGSIECFDMTHVIFEDKHLKAVKEILNAW